MKLPLGYVQADLPDGTKEYVTCMAEERLSKGEKLPIELLVGIVLQPREKPSDPITLDNFAANSTFVYFLHKIIANEGPNTDQLIVNAESIGEGTLYVIDSRVPRPKPGEEWVVSSEDVFGEFDVKDGMIVPESYRRNPDHRLYSSKGFFELEDELAECLLAELARLPEPEEGDYLAGGWQFIH
jgi:hypothetical protein